MVAAVDLSAGGAGIAGIGAALFAVEGLGKDESRCPFADALGPVKEKGVGHPRISNGVPENGDGSFLAVDR